MIAPLFAGLREAGQNARRVARLLDNVINGNWKIPHQQHFDVGLSWQMFWLFHASSELILSLSVPKPFCKPGEETLVMPTLVYRLLDPSGFVAFKMGRLRGGRKEHILIDT